MQLPRGVTPGKWAVPLAVRHFCPGQEPLHLGEFDQHGLVRIIRLRTRKLYAVLQTSRVEQPVGTGFSQGTPTATNENEVAEQFLGFFKNFVDTFGLQGKKVYITGESYAGVGSMPCQAVHVAHKGRQYYVPYIANAMLDANDTTYYDVEAILIYDPSTSTDAVQEQSKSTSQKNHPKQHPPNADRNLVPAVAFVDANANLFALNQSFTDSIHSRAATCNYTSFLSTYLTFPPPGPLPPPPNASAPGCDLFNDIFAAVTLINPCFDIYQIATTCPLLWDVLGFPGSFDYLPAGAEIYFNRTDVQTAIHAPLGPWAECSSGVLEEDDSPPSGLSILPSVIERLNKTVIAQGALDMILIANGTLLMIQNMTWGGKQGFQEKPAGEFFVPYHEEASLSTVAGAGVFGTTHTERGLTWVEVALTGHSEFLFIFLCHLLPPGCARWWSLRFRTGGSSYLSDARPAASQRDGCFFFLLE